MFARREVCGATVPCVAVYAVAIIAIIAYGHYLRKSGKPDILAKELSSHPLLEGIDGWSISHLAFFMLLGWMYPGQYLQFLAVGAGWEVVETCLGQNRLEVSGKRLQLVGDQDSDGRSTGKDDAYWYGKQSDVLMDMIGYAVGSELAARWWPANRTPPAVHA